MSDMCSLLKLLIDIIHGYEIKLPDLTLLMYLEHTDGKKVGIAHNEQLQNMYAPNIIKMVK